MKKYIQITKEDREFLMRAFGVTCRTVQNALRYDERRGGTALARKIRTLALQRGGVAMVALPEAELRETSGAKETRETRETRETNETGETRETTETR